MARVWSVLLVLGVCLSCAAAGAREHRSVAVLDLQFGGQADRTKVRALEDLLANEIRALGGLRVIGRGDILGLLKLEKQKVLAGCDDEQCLAEIGGALGVDWMVTGTVSEFGGTLLLNIKVLDVRGARVASSVSRKVTGGQQVLVDVIPAMVRELFGGLLGGKVQVLSVEQLEQRRRRIAWGHGLFWSGVGLLALGGGAAGIAYYQGTVKVPNDESASKIWEGVMWGASGIGVALLTAGIVCWTWEWEQRDSGEVVSWYPVLGAGVIGLGGTW